MLSSSRVRTRGRRPDWGQPFSVDHLCRLRPCSFSHWAAPFPPDSRWRVLYSGSRADFHKGGAFDADAVHLSVSSLRLNLGSGVQPMHLFLIDLSKGYQRNAQEKKCKCFSHMVIKDRNRVVSSLFNGKERRKKKNRRQCSANAMIRSDTIAFYLMSL